jgi:hypothetical protein
MSWTKTTPYFRAEETFGNFSAIINQELLGMIPTSPSTSYIDGPPGLQGVEQWVEFANWILEQARLYEEGPSDGDEQ